MEVACVGRVEEAESSSCACRKYRLSIKGDEGAASGDLPTSARVVGMVTVVETLPAETPFPEHPDATARWIDWAWRLEWSFLFSRREAGDATAQLARRGRARVAREVKATMVEAAEGAEESVGRGSRDGEQPAVERSERRAKWVGGKD